MLLLLLLIKAEDPHEALLVHRATPLDNRYGFSSAELCMGRKRCTTLPVIPSKQVPQLWSEMINIRETEEKLS